VERGECVQEEENKEGRGVAPEGLRGRDAVRGERAQMEVDCRLGERMTTGRTPGVR
jgi:hypothetical protein